MVLRAFSYDEMRNLNRNSERMVSAQYQDMFYDTVGTVRNHLVPFESFLGGSKWMFQQNNASVMYLNSPRKGLKRKNKNDILP